MKKNLLILAVLFFSVSLAMTQGNSKTILPLLGENAPSFTAESTNGIIEFPKDFGYSWKIIFSHPADFTPVCTSEIIALAGIQDELKKMKVDIVVVSTDNIDTHYQWVKSMESIEYNGKKTEEIKFPLVADNDHSISKEYGMIHPVTNSTEDVRGVFIIDPRNKIRAMFYYPMNIGRNMEEIKRTVLALQTADKEHVLTPANWKAGDNVLVPYIKYADGRNDLAKPEDPNVHPVSWYMWVKNVE
jgi:peroxiredoxin 2/4